MLIDAFLTEVQTDLEAVEKSLIRLESNPSDVETWQKLASFFKTVRAGAPFVAFPRSYKLADAALDEIASFQSGTRQIDILPQILKKYRRVKKIMSSAFLLKREIRESDEDLLGEKRLLKANLRPSNNAASVLLQTAQVLTQKEKNIVGKEKELDRREESLVLRQKALDDRENDLNSRENLVFRGEKQNADVQAEIEKSFAELKRRETVLGEKSTAVQSQEQNVQDMRRYLDEKADGVKELQQMVRRLTSDNELKDKKIIRNEKELAELHVELNERTAAAAELRDKLQTCEQNQKNAGLLLEARNKTIQEMIGKITALETEALTGTRNENRIQSDLNAALSEKQKQLDDSESALMNLQSEYARLHENSCKYAAAYTELKARFDETCERLAGIENIERQYTNLKKQFESLKNRADDSNKQLTINRGELKENLDVIERQNDELRAVGWPFDIEKIQRDFAGMTTRSSPESAAEMYGFIRQIRLKPLKGIENSLVAFVAKQAEKYGKRYTLSLDVPAGDIDRDAFAALDKILSVLADNSLRYVIGADCVTMAVSVKPDGAFLKVAFNDNADVFSYEKIRKAAVEAGLCSSQDAAELSKDRLLRCLFHPRVMPERPARGLLQAAELLERCGGQIDIKEDNGVRVEFSLPRQYLFDKVLMFENAGRKYAVPLNMVAETFAFNPNGADRGFYHQGHLLPVVGLPDAAKGEAAYGIVLQAGIFTFLLPVQKIAETDSAAAYFCDKRDGQKPYLIPLATLGGTNADWIDMACLLEQKPPEISKTANEGAFAKTQVSSTDNKSESYLIYRCDSKNVGAVPVDKVLKIEAFTGEQADKETGRPVFESDGKVLPLKDSSNKKHFPFAQTVLIFADYALAIQDVLDIVDAPVEKADKILYQGKKIPVLKD